MIRAAVVVVGALAWVSCAAPFGSSTIAAEDTAAPEASAEVAADVPPKDVLCGGEPCALPEVSAPDGTDVSALACDPATFGVTCADATHVRQCRSDGSAIETLSCGDGAVCLAGTCVTQTCTPGATACASANSAHTCNASGTGFDGPVACDSDGRCEAHRCLTACEIAGLERGARACRFVMPSGVARVEGVAGTSVMLDGVMQPALPANGATALELTDPSGAHVLVTGKPVQVTLRQGTAFGDEAQVLPPTAWGSDHVVLGWPNRVATSPSLVRIVGSGPGIRLSIAATADLEVLSGGEVVVATVGRGQAIALALPLSAQADLRVLGDTGDATGTRVTASGPVGVFFHHPCASVPAGVDPCAPLLEQLPPLDRLAPSALGVPLPPRAAPQPDVFRVVAADDHVQFTLAPAVLPPFTLERGAHATWIATEAVMVIATGRFALAHLAPGATYAGHGSECSGVGIGGAALTWVPPLSTVAGGTVRVEEAATATLELAMDAMANVTVDGQLPPVSKAPGDGGSYLRMTLSAGLHTIATPSGAWRGVVLEERCGGTRATPVGASMASTPMGAPGATAVGTPTDLDGDGSPNALDCAPEDANVHPKAVEGCNGVDDDCDGATDAPGAQGCLPWFADGDGDGSGTQSLAACACEPPTAVATPFGGDCDDKDPARGPLLLELCNATDDDCDGLIDEGCDDDDDGYCSEDAVVVTTEGVCAKGLGDCVDSSAAVNPAAKELSTNQLDDDCDGLTDMVSTTLPVSDCTGLKCTGPSHAAIVCALDLCYGPTVVTGLELLAPNGGDPKLMIAAVEQLGDPQNGLGPRAGTSSLVLSTGNVGATGTDIVAGTTSSLDPLPSFPFQIYDTAQVTLSLIVPDAATGLALDLLFMSVELPEDAGKPDVDRLYVLLTGSTSTSGAPQAIGIGPCTTGLALPETKTPAGLPACFIGVNSGLVQPCAGGPKPPTSLAGTPYACAAGGGSTGWLRVTHPVAGGETLTLTLRLADVGDAVGDSQAIIDNVRWLTGPVTGSLSPL